jgi:hypothetical protein
MRYTRTWLILAALACGPHLASAAQQSAAPPSPQVDVAELKALVFVLQAKLVAVEKELGQEKARRAELELADLQRARETLDPDVKKKLGIPVPDAPKPEPKPVTPPKE